MKNIFIITIALFLFCNINIAYGATFIPSTVIATTTGVAHLQIDQSVLNSLNLNGDPYSVNLYTKTNSYLSTVNANWCYPRAGGSTNFSNALGYHAQLKATEHQTSNTSGGSPLCNVSGNYLINFYSGGIEYFTIYYYNVTTNYFSSVPSPDIVATSTPFIKIVNPVNGGFVDNIFNMAVAINVGSSTYSVDNYRITFSSQDQVLDAKTGPVSGTGIINLTLPTYWPEYDDQIYATAYLLDGTTTRATTYNHLINVVVGGDPYATVNGGTIVTRSAECDNISGLSWAICKVTVTLFAPNEELLTDFSESQENLSTRWPFIYIYETPNLVAQLTNSSSTFPTVAMPMFGGTTTIMSQEMIDNVPFISYARNVMALFLYVLLVFFLYRKITNIHNKAT